MFEYQHKFDDHLWWMLTEGNGTEKMLSSTIGEYNIEGMIGKGTFSKVYLGQSIRTGQLVALKVLQKQSLTFDSMALFERELKSLTKITKHKNVLAIYDAFETDEMFVIVTEWCDGGDLLTLIKERGPLSEPECKFLMKGLLYGLVHIHERHRLAHRDLKLENVFMTRSGRVVLGDFGLSKEYTTQLWTRCGSEEYAAPEKLLGRAPYVAEKVDVWSFGVIFYACMKAKLPFTRNNKISVNSENPLSLYNQILHKPIEIQGVSAECREIISRTLERDSAKRAGLRELLNMKFFD